MVPPDLIALALVLSAMAFTLSAAAGMGGSLILVPSLSLLFGPKQGIALAALLLAANNVCKVYVYRKAVPWRHSAGVVLLMALGSFAGARLLVELPATWVGVAIVVGIGGAFVLERFAGGRIRRAPAPALALGAGATSGFSGTSGPLKGAALRSFGLDRFHLAGAASLVSLTGDAVKASVFARASLLGQGSLEILVLALPLMPLATLAGRRLNREVGEAGYTVLFWSVMAGYSLRLVQM